MMLPIVGIDISADWFDVYVFPNKLRNRFANNTTGFKQLAQWLKSQGIQQFRSCMEATGLYFEGLAEYMYKNGQEVVVVNPQCIKSYARSELRRAKSDPLDAEIIATYCKDKYERLNLWEPMRPEVKEVRELTRRRAQLVTERTAEKNRKQAGYSSPEMIASIKRNIAFLDKEIKYLESLIKRLVTKDPVLSKSVQLVQTIPGIGFLTAVVVLVEVPAMLWTGRLASAFAGLVPHRRSSGKSKVQTHISRVGSPRLRQALYWPAITASRLNPLLKAFYQRLLKRGLKKMQAIAAVMRKLLHQIFGLLKNDEPFDSQFELKRRQRLLSAA